MKATAALKAADRNPYSWNMDFYEYPHVSGYETCIRDSPSVMLLSQISFGCSPV